MHCVDLGESFPTSIYLQKSASIQPRTSPSKFGGNYSLLFNRVLSCVSSAIWTPRPFRLSIFFKLSGRLRGRSTRATQGSCRSFFSSSDRQADSFFKMQLSKEQISFTYFSFH